MKITKKTYHRKTFWAFIFTIDVGEWISNDIVTLDGALCYLGTFTHIYAPIKKSIWLRFTPRVSRNLFIGFHSHGVHVQNKSMFVTPQSSEIKGAWFQTWMPKVTSGFLGHIYLVLGMTASDPYPKHIQLKIASIIKNATSKQCRIKYWKNAVWKRDIFDGYSKYGLKIWWENFERILNFASLQLLTFITQKIQW